MNPGQHPTVEAISEAFHRDGFYHLSGVVSPDELEALRADTAEIIAAGGEGHENPSDYFVDPLPGTNERVFHRVQYVFPKARRNSLVILLGHPLLLEVVHHLLGDDFICEAEALVFKQPGNGREVPVHADCDPSDARLAPLIFNVDIYLDDATVENGCLWAVPGSHHLGLSPREIGERGFDFPGMQPVPVRAGDVLLHNVRLVHGSHRNTASALRRTLYYEFMPMSELLKQGGPRPDFPVNDAWIRDRFRLQMHAIDARKRANYAAGETPYPYHVPAGYDVPWPGPDEPVNYRPALGYNKYL